MRDWGGPVALAILFGLAISGLVQNVRAQSSPPYVRQWELPTPGLSSPIRVYRTTSSCVFVTTYAIAAYPHRGDGC